MKKLLLIALLSFLTSCSSDSNSEIINPIPNPDSNIVPGNGTVLKSYKYNSSTATEHFFSNNGNVYDKVEGGGFLKTKYFYDINNKMSKIEEYYSNGNISTRKEFFYDSNGKINKITFFDGTFTNSWEFSRSGNVVTGAKLGGSGNVTDNKVRYTFNADGLLIKFEKYIDNSGTLQYSDYATFVYDNNKNVIELKRSYGGVHDVIGGQTPTSTNLFTHTYDSKINPLHNVYMNYYENFILIQNDVYAFGLPYGSTYRTYGKNNILETNYPSNYPYEKYKYEYLYQANNLPAKCSLIKLSDNSVSESFNLNYE